MVDGTEYPNGSDKPIVFDINMNTARMGVSRFMQRTVLSDTYDKFATGSSATSLTDKIRNALSVPSKRVAALERIAARFVKKYGSGKKFLKDYDIEVDMKANNTGKVLITHFTFTKYNVDQNNWDVDLKELEDNLKTLNVSWLPKRSDSSGYSKTKGSMSVVYSINTDTELEDMISDLSLDSVFESMQDALTVSIDESTNRKVFIME